MIGKRYMDKPYHDRDRANTLKKQSQNYVIS